MHSNRFTASLVSITLWSIFTQGGSPLGGVSVRATSTIPLRT
jgi:hypothetical protein